MGFVTLEKSEKEDKEAAEKKAEAARKIQQEELAAPEGTVTTDKASYMSIEDAREADEWVSYY